MSNTKKALLVTTVSGFVPQFEMNNVHILQSMGFEVHYASNYNTPSYGTDNHRLDGTGIIKLTLFAVPSNLQILKSIASCVPLWNRKAFSWYTAIPLWEELWPVWRLIRPIQAL